MLRLRLVVGNVVRSLGCGGGYTSSTRQRGVYIMGEFMSTMQYNTIWPTLSRHFEYLISFHKFYNCLILSSLYHHIIWVSEDMQLCILGKCFI